MTTVAGSDNFYALETEWRAQLSQWATSGLLEAAALEALNLRSRPSALQELIARWAKGDFSGLPPIELLPASSLPGAAGAYAASTGTIYLNQDWLAGASNAQAIAVLTEELGHHLDVLLNSSDTPGDEGELFARTLAGEGQLDAKQLMAIRRQDDSGIAWIYGKLLNVENSAVMELTPQLSWTRQLGSISTDSADAITTGNDGLIYIGGFSEGNIDGQTNSGKRDGFISKYNSDGIKVWTKLIFADGQISDLTTGKDGAIYVAGNQRNNGIWGGFVSKYNSDGIKEWTKLPPPSSWSAYALTTGIDSAIYVSGYASSSIDGQIAIGFGDAFISKYNADGTKVWSRLLGTSKTDFSTDITTGNDSSIYICGDTDGNLAGQTNNGLRDAFISKHSTDGSRAWTKIIGTSYEERSRALTTGKDGSIYICGDTEGNLDGQTNSGKSDVFISKYSTDGIKVWTRMLGTSSDDYARALTTGIDGSIYVSGGTNGNLDGGNDAGAYGAFISKYSSDGSKLWTKLIGSSNADDAKALQIGSDGAIYVGGMTGGNIDGQANSGGFDAYISKYYPDDGNNIQGGTASKPTPVNNSGIANSGTITNLQNYTLTSSASSINEGSSITTSVTTTNVALGTALYYSLSGTGINTADFSSGSLTGSGIVSSSGSFSFSHTLANDLATEGTETLNIKLFSDTSRSTQVGSTASVSIADTSITPVIKNTGAAAFSISGKGDIGSQLSIIKTKDDPEGNGKFTYKWQSSVDGTNWTNLAATSSSYTIAATDASKQLRASISYLDGKSNSESVDTSALSISAVASTKLTAGDFATPININLSLPAYIMSTNWNIDKYYYYVEQYPMTLRTAFYADYLAGRYTNQALYGQNHYLTGGQAEGRSMPGTDGILPDSNDYGAYVENYGITLLDIYRVDSRAVVNGGTMSLFAWGKEHYTNWGKAEGREISGGVEWGGIVRNNLDLYNQWQDAKIANPTLSAFAFGYQLQNTIKSTLGVLVGSDTADKLTGQIAYGLNGNDVICSDGGRGILAGGFGDDLLVAANGGSDLAYGGPGSDIFQLNAGSSFNIRDFRKGADMIQLGSTLTSSGVTMQWDSADNSTLFYNGSSVIGKVYGKRPTEFTYSDSTNGVSKVYI